MIKVKNFSNASLRSIIVDLEEEEFSQSTKTCNVSMPGELPIRGMLIFLTVQYIGAIALPNIHINSLTGLTVFSGLGNSQV